MNAGKASLGGVVASPAADCRDQANETKFKQEKFLFQNITELCDPFFKPELFAKHEENIFYDLMISTRYSTDETFKHN